LRESIYDAAPEQRHPDSRVIAQNRRFVHRRNHGPPVPAPAGLPVRRRWNKPAWKHRGPEETAGRKEESEFVSFSYWLKSILDNPDKLGTVKGT
jgi:hypothetical protein